MSGGHFDYRNDSLCLDITGEYPDYGASGRKNSEEEAAEKIIEGWAQEHPERSEEE